MKKPAAVSALALGLLPALAHAQSPPVVSHQPALCTEAEKPLLLCAEISDDGTVAAARLYFRREGEDYYSFVDMTFTGLDYCGILPSPRRKKTKAIEYYVQAIDDSYEPARTSTFRLPVQEEGVCEFAPTLDQDDSRAASIKVFATSRKQGDDLDDGFRDAGVTFVPVRK
jgi:hypothetical protein